MRERQMEFEDLAIRRALESVDQKPASPPPARGSRWWKALKTLGRRPAILSETAPDRTQK